MENLELACFQLISSVGMAKSAFIEAVQEAKKETLIRQTPRSKREIKPLYKDMELMPD